MRWHRDYDGGYPPLASDVMPEERDEDGGDDHTDLLREALGHAVKAAKHLGKAVDLMGDNLPANPEDKATRAALIRRALRAAAASSI